MPVEQWEVWTTEPTQVTTQGKKDYQGTQASLGGEGYVCYLNYGGSISAYICQNLLNFTL